MESFGASEVEMSFPVIPSSDADDLGNVVDCKTEDTDCINVDISLNLVLDFSLTVSDIDKKSRATEDVIDLTEISLKL